MRRPIRGLHPYDFVVYDCSGEVSFLIEAKAKIGANSDWAANWYRDAITSRGRPKSGQVVLVTPDKFYFWNPASSGEMRPQHTADARPFLNPYFDRLKVTRSEVAYRVFEDIVALWLLESSGKESTCTSGPAGDLLRDVRAGRVAHEGAA